MKLTIETLVPAIRSIKLGFDPEKFPSNKDPVSPVEFEYFHLSSCVCGCPTWQQPCPHCDFYADFDNSAWNAKLVEQKAGSYNKEKFCRDIERAGNIGKFFALGILKSCAPEHWKKARYEQFLAIITDWEFPSASDIWDAFRDKDRFYKLNYYKKYSEV